MSEEWKLGYLAGFIDGEGSISIDKRPTGQYSVRVTVSNTDLPTLEFLQAEFGGHIHTRSTPFHCKQVYILRWSGHEAQPLLEQILPMLSIKKDRARILLAFPLRRSGQRNLDDEDRILRESLYQKMKDLNKLGMIITITDKEINDL